MKYSVTVSDYADPASFAELKNAVAELYPDFSFERTIKEEGEAETALYVCGDRHICAEINYATKKVQASSDMPLTELTEYFGLSKKAAKKAKNGLPDFRSPKLWKYGIVPAALLLLAGIVAFIRTFPDAYALVYPLRTAAGAVTLFAYTLGWIWFIPLLAAAIAAARFGKDKLCKLFVAAVPLIGAVRLCLTYPDTCWDIYEMIIIIPFMGMYFGITGIVYLLLAAYILALPYMAANDISGSVCVKSGGKRPRKLFTALCWIISAVVSITAVCVTGIFANLEDIREEATYSAELEEQAEQRSIEYDRIYMEYGGDMLAAAGYSVQHRYYDWYNCPETSMENVWERLFNSEGLYYTALKYTPAKNGGYVKMSTVTCLDYYIYPDTREICYDGKTVCFGGETV